MSFQLHRRWRLGFAVLVVSLIGNGFLPETFGQATQTVSQRSGITATSQPHPLDPALELAKSSLQHIQSNVFDYTALFVKRCRVDGVLPELQYANIKVRNPKNGRNGAIPFSVYLDFQKPSSVEGREVIWVQGRNNNRMTAHNGGLLNIMSVDLDPMGALAMRGQRRPITEIGIENLVKKVIEIGERDKRLGDCQVQFFKNAKIGETVCTMVQVNHPEKRPGYDFCMARVYFADALKMPIRYEAWTWPNQAGGQPMLDEEYNYLNLRVNVGLTESDFDINNPDYNF